MSDAFSAHSNRWRLEEPASGFNGSPDTARLRATKLPSADRKAKEAAGVVGPLKEPGTRYLSAVFSLLKDLLKQAWSNRWSIGSKIRFTHRLTPTPTPSTRALYAGLSKGKSALLTKLRTGKIGFNAFLHELRVPGILSSVRMRIRRDDGTALYSLYALSGVIYVVVIYLTVRYLSGVTVNTLDVRRILNSSKGSKPAVEFILATNLLPQFQRIANEEQVIRREIE